MKRSISLILASAAVAAACTASFAQSQPSGFSARIGAFFPSDGDARDESSTWLAAGIQYRIKDMEMAASGGMMSSLAISADWFGAGDFRSVPVLLNWVGESTEGYFLSVGAGVAFNQVPVFVGGGTEGTIGGGTETENRTSFAYQLGIGYNFRSGGTMPLFIEAKYFGSGDSELNGFGVYLGVRF